MQKVKFYQQEIKQLKLKVTEMSLKDKQEEKKGQKLNETILLWENKSRGLLAKIVKEGNEKKNPIKIPNQEGSMIKSCIRD